MRLHGPDRIYQNATGSSERSVRLTLPPLPKLSVRPLRNKLKPILFKTQHNHIIYLMITTMSCIDLPGSKELAPKLQLLTTMHNSEL